MERVLYQFPISHYCEKVRWVLDFKGMPYRIHNQLPGPHMLVNRVRTGRSTVPILVEDGKAIRGSHAIALHLEAVGSSQRLLPESPVTLAKLDELVRQYDRVIGPAVRRYAYRFITARPEMFRHMVFREYKGPGRVIGEWMSVGIGRPSQPCTTSNRPRRASGSDSFCCRSARARSRGRVRLSARRALHAR